MQSAHHVETVEERHLGVWTDPAREVDTVGNAERLGLRHQRRAQFAVTGDRAPKTYPLLRQQAKNLWFGTIRPIAPTLKSASSLRSSSTSRGGTCTALLISNADFRPTDRRIDDPLHVGRVPEERHPPSAYA